MNFEGIWFGSILRSIDDHWFFGQDLMEESLAMIFLKSSGLEKYFPRKMFSLLEKQR
jgi:hypothetical protein